jgi:hypothetical protein
MGIKKLSIKNSYLKTMRIDELSIGKVNLENKTESANRREE